MKKNENLSFLIISFFILKGVLIFSPIYQFSLAPPLNINTTNRLYQADLIPQLTIFANLQILISDFLSHLRVKIFAEPEVIPYTKARDYAGRTKIVEGQIKEVLNNRQAVYLGFQKPHKGAFVVRIMKENWQNFEDIPDRLYKEGQKVQITGNITWYQGDPVIYITHPSQIKIIE